MGIVVLWVKPLLEMFASTMALGFHSSFLPVHDDPEVGRPGRGFGLLLLAGPSLAMWTPGDN